MVHTCFTRMVFLIGALALVVGLAMASPLLAEASGRQAAESALTADVPTQAFVHTVAYSSYQMHAAPFVEIQPAYQPLPVHTNHNKKWKKRGRNRDDKEVVPPTQQVPEGDSAGVSAGASAQTTGSTKIPLDPSGSDVISRSITAPYNGGLHVVLFNATVSWVKVVGGAIIGNCSISRDDGASTVPNGHTPKVTWAHRFITPELEDIKSISVSGTWPGTMSSVTYTATCQGGDQVGNIVMSDISLNVIVVPNDFSGL